jgi:hypothetical protein
MCYGYFSVFAKEHAEAISQNNIYSSSARHNHRRVGGRTVRGRMGASAREPLPLTSGCFCRFGCTIAATSECQYRETDVHNTWCAAVIFSNCSNVFHTVAIAGALSAIAKMLISKHILFSEFLDVVALSTLRWYCLHKYEPPPQQVPTCVSQPSLCLTTLYSQICHWHI